MDDKKIIELYIERSEKAISETDAKYGNYCRTIALNILYDNGEAEECTNDTYLKLWNTIPPKIPVLFKAFIAKIARNTALNIYEKKNTAKRNKGQTAVSLDELAECIDSGSNIEAGMERKEVIAALNEFLEGLDRNKRIYFMQRYFYMLPVKEIAEKHNISEGSLKTMLCRIRADLKKFIQERNLY
ncbi:MAG: sigma-70 family RNA polymerase sigma factor [Oscillospiraceae bacterium]|nr:sigma-70 family RNA polymerase sigma factor [Oscillospiraceae bacterium]